MGALTTNSDKLYEQLREIQIGSFNLVALHFRVHPRAHLQMMNAAL